MTDKIKAAFGAFNTPKGRLTTIFALSTATVLVAGAAIIFDDDLPPIIKQVMPDGTTVMGQF